MDQRQQSDGQEIRDAGAGAISKALPPPLPLAALLPHRGDASATFIRYSSQQALFLINNHGPKPLSEPAKAITIYIDADACPVKAETYRVAERYGIKVCLVSNSHIAAPREPFIERVIVGSGPDAADDWIAERASRGSIVVTADIPLAHRCVKAGASVIAPNGRILEEASIGIALATRNLMDELRSAGQTTGGPKPFEPRDRSNFLSSLDLVIVRLKREGFAA